MSIDQEVSDALVDGRITDQDAEAVLMFAEFLRVAGRPDGGALVRLREAGREDLIEWALARGA